MKDLIHLFLILLSLGLAVLIFLISHEALLIDYICIQFHYVFTNSFTYLLYFIIFSLLVLLTYLSIYFIKGFDQYELNKKEISSYEQANDFYLPVYLGYAFVSISLPTFKSFVLFFLMMLVILFQTKFYYFNPLLLILGYKCYFITKNDKSKILLITKKEIKILEDLFKQKQSVDLFQLNDYTYVFID